MFLKNTDFKTDNCSFLVNGYSHCKNNLRKIFKVILSSFLSTTHPKHVSPISHKLSVLGPMVKYIQTTQQGLKCEAPTEEVTYAMELTRVCVMFLKDTFAV